MLLHAYSQQLLHAYSQPPASQLPSQPLPSQQMSQPRAGTPYASQAHHTPRPCSRAATPATPASVVLDSQARGQYVPGTLLPTLYSQHAQEVQQDEGVWDAWLLLGDNALEAAESLEWERGDKQAVDGDMGADHNMANQGLGATAAAATTPPAHAMAMPQLQQQPEGGLVDEALATQALARRAQQLAQRHARLWQQGVVGYGGPEEAVAGSPSVTPPPSEPSSPGGLSHRADEGEVEEGHEDEGWEEEGGDMEGEGDGLQQGLKGTGYVMRRAGGCGAAGANAASAGGGLGPAAGQEVSVDAEGLASEQGGSEGGPMEVDGEAGECQDLGAMCEPGSSQGHAADMRNGPDSCSMSSGGGGSGDDLLSSGARDEAAAGAPSWHWGHGRDACTGSGRQSLGSEGKEGDGDGDGGSPGGGLPGLLQGSGMHALMEALASGSDEGPDAGWVPSVGGDGASQGNSMEGASDEGGSVRRVGSFGVSGGGSQVSPTKHQLHTSSHPSPKEGAERSHTPRSTTRRGLRFGSQEFTVPGTHSPGAGAGLEEGDCAGGAGCGSPSTGRPGAGEGAGSTAKRPRTRGPLPAAAPLQPVPMQPLPPSTSHLSQQPTHLRPTAADTAQTIDPRDLKMLPGVLGWGAAPGELLLPWEDPDEGDGIYDVEGDPHTIVAQALQPQQRHMVHGGAWPAMGMQGNGTEPLSGDAEAGAGMVSCAGGVDSEGGLSGASLGSSLLRGHGPDGPDPPDGTGVMGGVGHAQAAAAAAGEEVAAVAGGAATAGVGAVAGAAAGPDAGQQQSTDPPFPDRVAHRQPSSLWRHPWASMPPASPSPQLSGREWRPVPSALQQALARSPTPPNPPGSCLGAHPAACCARTNVL